MSENKKTEKNKAKNYFKILIINIIISMFFLFVFSAACVVFDVKKEFMNYISFVFIGFTSFTVGFINGIRERKNGMIKGVISALPIIVILFIISILINGFDLDVNMVFSALFGLLLSAVGGIISVNIRIKK